MHVSAAFEFNGVGGSDPQQARADPNCWQCPCPDLLVHLLAADKPILRQFRDGHVRLGMGLEVLYAHVTVLAGNLVSVRSSGPVRREIVVIQMPGCQPASTVSLALVSLALRVSTDGLSL